MRRWIPPDAVEGDTAMERGEERGRRPLLATEVGIGERARGDFSGTAKSYPRQPSLSSGSGTLRIRKPGALAPPHSLPRRRRDVSAAYGDGDMDDDDFDADDADGVGDDDDVDNEVDYDVHYGRLIAPVVAGFPPPRGPAGEEGDIAMVAAESFVSTQGSASDTVVDYAVDEDEFHKIRLLHCDFLIRKVPDPDDDVFRLQLDTDIYSIARVLAPMPQKHVRCTKSEPPVEHLRDPLYNTERAIVKAIHVITGSHYLLP